MQGLFLSGWRHRAAAVKMAGGGGTHVADRAPGGRLSDDRT